MEDIELKELLIVILKKWWLILICCIITTGIAAYYSYYVLQPIYQANTVLYVGKNTETKGASVSDLNLGAQLISDYREITKSRIVSSAVIEELGLKHVSPSSMANRIAVSQRADSRMIQISVVDVDPNMAMVLTNKVAEVFQKKVIEIMQVENVQIIDTAELPRNPISPNKRRNVILGFILGCGLGVGIIFLLEFFDDRIKTSEDITRYIDLPIIGNIPVFPKR